MQCPICDGKGKVSSRIFGNIEKCWMCDGKGKVPQAVFGDRPSVDSLGAALCDVQAEVIRAQAKHPRPFSSLHEAHSVLREEFDEFWDEVKKQHTDKSATRTELVQVAAMAVRALVELLPS